MEYTPISPFMRPISAAHLRVVDDTVKHAGALPARPVNKWVLLRELSKAQAAFGVSERDLTVLQGLLSFFPGDELGTEGTEGDAMIVFPSNKAICERLNGMPCSTMRRHLARLVQAGLIARRDSPNGKRFQRREGDDRMVFGFDLAPLHARAEAIARAAEAVRAEESHCKRLRVIVSLMRRDAAALAEFGASLHPGLALWEELAAQAAETGRALRRKLSSEALTAHRAAMARALDAARDVIDGPATEEMNTNDARIEQHHHNSNKDSLESEPGFEKAKGANAARPSLAAGLAEDTGEGEPESGAKGQGVPRIPLHLVLAACPSLRDFHDGPIRHWHQLFDAACGLRPSMGISPSAWDEAQRCMGPEAAAITLVAMLERFDEIRSPGGYLRSLSGKASAGAFSCGPMIMALLSRRHAA